MDRLGTSTQKRECQAARAFCKLIKLHQPPWVSERFHMHISPVTQSIVEHESPPTKSEQLDITSEAKLEKTDNQKPRHLAGAAAVDHVDPVGCTQRVAMSCFSGLGPRDFRI